MAIKSINNTNLKCNLLNRKAIRNGHQQNIKSNDRKRYTSQSIQAMRFQHRVYATNIESKGLASQNLSSILNDEGIIDPVVESNAKAFIFAIFDSNKKVQYIGFSKGLETSLRTVFTRRPDKAYYYKAISLTKLDQKEMMAVRDLWFEEIGGPPSGNKLALEKAAWQQALDVSGEVGAVGKLKAAEDKVKMILEQIKERGCKESFIPDPELLQDGKVDMIPEKSLSEEEVKKRKEEMEAIVKATRVSKTVINGEESEFSVFFSDCIQTNGGEMIDVTIGHDGEETKHRVIVGKDYFEPFNITGKDIVTMAFAFILSKKLERQTEGMLLSTQFPINYFAVAELDQVFEDFRDYFKQWFGHQLEGDKFWRFNRIHNYGFKEELEGTITIPLGSQYLAESMETATMET